MRLISWIKNFFRGIKRGWTVGKKGGVLDVMWCSRCGTKQPIYMDSTILRCAGCDRVITAVDEGVIEIDIEPSEEKQSDPK